MQTDSQMNAQMELEQLRTEIYFLRTTLESHKNDDMHKCLRLAKKVVERSVEIAHLKNELNKACDAIEEEKKFEVKQQRAQNRIEHLQHKLNEACDAIASLKREVYDAKSHAEAISDIHEERDDKFLRLYDEFLCLKDESEEQKQKIAELEEKLAALTPRTN